MDAYVSKPIQAQKLVEAIERHIPGSVPAKAKTNETGPSPEERIFDRCALLHRLDGDEELCNKLLGDFVEDASAQLAKLKQGLAGNDAAQVEKQAHTLKGSSATMGAQALSGVAFEMETAGREHRLDKARSLVAALEQEFEKLRGVLSGVGI